MTDIVKRLRAYHSPQWGSALKDVHDAADEIERLRSAITTMIDGIERWLETGVPAGLEESKAIYEQLCRAVGRRPKD